MKKYNARNKKYRDVELNDLKKWFVDLGKEISEETGDTYQNLMYKIQTYENEFMGGKDLYNFSKEEILGMYATFGSSSVATLNVYTSIIRKYFELAMSEEAGYLKNKINQANNIYIEDLIELTNKQVKDKKIVTKDFFYNLVEEKIVNYQDQAMLLLPFEGIRGTNNGELENLETKDIDFDNNTIKIIRDEKELVINISKRLCNVLFRASLQKEYRMHNGVTKTNDRGLTTGGTTRELVSSDDTPYFFRSIAKKSDSLNIKGKAIQSRIIKNCNMYLDLPFITPSSIYLSGIIYRLIKYSEELKKDVLDHKDVADYLDKFNEKLNSYQTYVAYKDAIGEEN